MGSSYMGNVNEPYDPYLGTWSNPNSGNSGTITPIAIFTQNGRYCVEFKQWISNRGSNDTFIKTSCRLENGDWTYNY